MEATTLAASPIMKVLQSASATSLHHASQLSSSSMNTISNHQLSSTNHSEEFFNEFNENSTTTTNNVTPTTTDLFTLPSSDAASTTMDSSSTITGKTKKKTMKKKQSDQVFMNQSVIFNHEGKKQRNKTIYTVNHPKVSDLLAVSNFQFQVGQEVEVKVCEYKSDKKTEHFSKIIIEHLGYTNQHNMDASKTIAIEFVNVLAFKRRKNDSKILWIYESVVLDLLNNERHQSPMNESPVLKRKLDSMSESDQSSSGSTTMNQSQLEDEFEKCFLEVAANPFIDPSLLSNDTSKKSKLDSNIENLYLEGIEPEDAPSKKPTLFQLSLELNIEQAYHLFNPLMRNFYLDFVSYTEEQTSFDATIISVQPIITNMASLKGKKFELIGKTPIISMYDNVNTFVRLCVDTQIFMCKNSNEERLSFYFYGEDKRMKSEQIIQNPNTYSKKSDLDSNNNSSNSGNTDIKVDSTFSDLILFDLGNEDNFLFEQFKNVNLESKKYRNLLYDRYVEFCKEMDETSEEAIKSLVHIQDALGFTLLMHFAARNMIEEVRSCLYWGASISQQDSFGHDALFWSKHFKANRITELLTQIITEIDQTRGDRFDEIAFQQQLRSRLVDASSRLEKRQTKAFKENSTEFSSEDEELSTTLK